MTKSKFNLILSSPFLLLILFTFNPVKVFGQGTKITPDCVVFVNVTLAAQTTVAVPTVPMAGGVGDNRTEGCQSWTFTYQATGTGAITSLDFQAGQSSTTTVTFASWAGTVSTGINPNTSSTGATSTFTTGCTSAVACTVANSWVRILITRGTFAGTVNGVLYGFKAGSGGGGGGGGGGGCTVAVPCVVDGPTAAGSAPTTPPVLVAGQDGAPGNIRTLKTDANGQPIVLSGQTANSTTTWTSATPQDTALTISTVNYGNVAFGYTKTGSITGGVVSFEATMDGTNWVPISVVSIGSSTTGTTNVTLTQGNTLYQMFVGGLTQFRLRLSTVITGTGSVAFFMNASVIGTEFQQVVTQGSGLSLHTNVDALPGATTAQADGQTNSPVQPVATVSGTATKTPNYPYKFNGATWDRDFVCTLSAPITFSAASGSVQIVGLSGSTVIRVCHLSISANTATNFTIQYGTGSACGTGTTALSGAYNNVTTLALDLNGTLRAPAGQAVCINSSGTITAGGIVTYAQF
jgi:hypothetical protein